MADPYSTLGIARNASEKDIKSAYRTLAKELHPDRNKDNPNAAERFSQVTNAYDLLSDKDQRARYDRGEIDEDGNPIRVVTATVGAAVEALDDQPVDLAFLLLAPEGAGADHLKALSRVARLLRDQDLVKKLRASDSESAIYAFLNTDPDSSAA